MITTINEYQNKIKSLQREIAILENKKYKLVNEDINTDNNNNNNNDNNNDLAIAQRKIRKHILDYLVDVRENPDEMKAVNQMIKLSAPILLDWCKNNKINIKKIMLLGGISSLKSVDIAAIYPITKNGYANHIGKNDGSFPGLKIEFETELKFKKIINYTEKR